jgi:hypothetical protein
MSFKSVVVPQFKFALIFLFGFLLLSCEQKETIYKDADIKIFKVLKGNWLEGAFFDYFYVTINGLEPMALEHTARPIFKDLISPVVFNEFRSDDHYLFLDTVTEYKQLHSFLYLSPKVYSKNDFQVINKILKAKIKMFDSVLNTSSSFAHQRMRICGTVYADFDGSAKWFKKRDGTKIKVMPDGRISLIVDQGDQGASSSESSIGIVCSEGIVKIDSATIKKEQLLPFIGADGKSFINSFAVNNMEPIAFYNEDNVLWIEGSTGQIYVQMKGDSSVSIGYLDGSSLYREGKGDTSVVLKKSALKEKHEELIYSLISKDLKFSRLFKRVIVRKDL